MLARTLVALSLLIWQSFAWANNSCPSLFEADSASASRPRPYSVLAFVGAEKPLTPEARNKRSQAMRALERQATNRLQNYWRNMAAQMGEPSPVVVLIACDADIEPLEEADARRMAPRKVLSVVWGSNDDGTASVVHVSVPQYYLEVQKNAAAAMPMEIAWKQSAPTANGLESLNAELTREGIAQQTLLALGIGLASIEAAQWRMAKRSLCQVLANLRALSAETLRPRRSELEGNLRTLVWERLSYVEAQAAASKVDVSNDSKINLTCAAGVVQ